MTANYVTTTLQVSHAIHIKKSVLAKKRCGDKEMSSPALFAELIAHVKSALASVVKGQQQVTSRSREIYIGNKFRYKWTSGDACYILCKLHHAVFIRNR